MCNLCTTTNITPIALGPQRPRRPRKRPGQHTPDNRRRLFIHCDGTATRVWFTRKGIRCVVCWNYLEGDLADDMGIELHNRFRDDLSQRNNLVADDFDDSDTGLRELAEQLQKLHPYLRLQTAGRRANLFRIASFQHSIIALDDAVDLHSAITIATALEQKLTAEIDALLKAATK